jgi:hypothetical protein
VSANFTPGIHHDFWVPLSTVVHFGIPVGLAAARLPQTSPLDALERPASPSPWMAPVRLLRKPEHR